MKTTEEVPEYAAGDDVSKEETLKNPMEAKLKEFVQEGAKAYAKA
jgi:hypothetical protein